jgi:magnesium transporter
MISATLSSTILNRFEALLPAVLVLFVPMLMDTGGNSGAQVSVTVIRSISLGEIDKRSVLPIIIKEVLCGLMTGTVLAAVAFTKVILIDRLLMQNPEVTLAVALAVAIALAATVVIAKLTGALLPIAAKAVGLDPAVMASPFITTLVDAVALVLYFFISAALVGMA